MRLPEVAYNTPSKGTADVPSLLPFVLYVLISTVAYLATRGVVRWVVRLGMQDIPGERSSHTVPTPRGGGIVICGLVLACALGTVWKHPAAAPWAWATLIGGSLVAGVGWIDDRRSVPPIVRFLVHLLGAFAVFGAMGFDASIEILPGISLTGITALGFVVLFVTWMINLYNFMDGIDGLAGGQATTVALGMSLIAHRHANTPLLLLAVTLSAAAFGFLVVNWHPARVFMGDVGSGFLGFLFALLSVWGGVESSVPFSGFLVLMAYFVVDATLTLMRRALRREKVWEAHRDHAYQHAVRSGWSHAQVSGAVVGANLMLLLPAAIVMDTWRAAQWPVLLVVYAGLAAVVLWFRAGVRMP